MTMEQKLSAVGAAAFTVVAGASTTVALAGAERTFAALSLPKPGVISCKEYPIVGVQDVSVARQVEASCASAGVLSSLAALALGYFAMKRSNH
jgi:hypothetical protein